MWASNTDQGTLLRVPVTATGAPGLIQVIASNLAGIDDFKFLSSRSDVAFVALNAPDEIAVVYPDGRSKIVLTASDGLASPTDTAARGTRIFITNAGIATPHDAKLQSGKINLAALLDGAANTRVIVRWYSRPLNRCGVPTCTLPCRRSPSGGDRPGGHAVSRQVPLDLPTEKLQVRGLFEFRGGR